MDLFIFCCWTTYWFWYCFCFILLHVSVSVLLFWYLVLSPPNLIVCPMQRIPFLFINQRRNPCPGYVILNVSSGETRTEGLKLDPNYQYMYSNGTWALLWKYIFQQAKIVAVRLMLLNLEEACGKTIGLLIVDEVGDSLSPSTFNGHFHRST